MRVRTEAKRDAIVEAAAAVFRESGFEGASMAEIASRVGGSKATLYGYFGSKEDLFIEVMHGQAKSHFDPIFAALENDHEDLRQALQRFGERTLTVLCKEAPIQTRRTVIAESGRSDIGRRFYESGPKKGLIELGKFLSRQMELGKLRHADPLVVASHLTALLDSETITARVFGLEAQLSRKFIKEATARALETFFAGYAPTPIATDGG